MSVIIIKMVDIFGNKLSKLVGWRENWMKGTAQARQDLERLLNKLISDYAPRQVFLFGSHVYGEPDQHSDLDLLIVKETAKTPFQRRVEVGRIVQDKSRRTPIQPLVITPEELEKRIQSGDPFLTEIVERGEVLYDVERVQAVG
jgi:predicted nucleotidyltransferase